MSQKKIEREGQIIQFWYEYGKDHYNDDIIRFIAFWVTFNALYSREKKYPNEPELDQIERFVDKNRNLLSKYNPYTRNPGEEKAIKYYVNEPVIDDGGNCVLISVSDKRICNLFHLFKAIYYVRCNLFHGSKNLLSEDERNMKLVANATILLEGYLETLRPLMMI